jgi:hypothetical protein
MATTEAAHSSHVSFALASAKPRNQSEIMVACYDGERKVRLQCYCQ